MKAPRISLFLFFFALGFQTPSLASAEDCNAPSVTAAAIEKIRELGRNNPSWLAKIQFWIPYFRMNDVAFTIISVRTKGPVRTGLDCEFVVKMMPPPDVQNTNGVQGTFGYVVMPKSDGTFDIDLY